LSHFRENICCALAAIGLSGCASRFSSESALNPAGPQAERIALLFWVFLGVGVVVWLVVMLFLALALSRKQQDEQTPPAPNLTPSIGRDRRLHFTIGSFVAATVLVLLVLMIGEFATARATHLFGESPKNPISIQITGHQWWWEIEYQDGVPSNIITTANELVIPVGRPVEIKLQSQDVIHSFWAPNLHGKKDLVPGHPANLWLQADHIGMYWGECAEFCGYQHAQMRLAIKVVSPQDFDVWLTESRKPARAPLTDSEKRGREVFLSSSCVLCHHISGIGAYGHVGPNLTHVGSHALIAAGALDHTRQNLHAWLADPQAIKPGSQMPQTKLSTEAIQALTEYLESLK
jgi:cytochrome c oxidase subunit 2